MPAYGYGEGDPCGRGMCQGRIIMHDVEGCSCHISPPCSACVNVTAYCPSCGWEEMDDPLCVHDTPVIYIDSHFNTYSPPVKRVLDPTKIDYITQSHSTSSQKCVGVYPEGITSKEVEAVVKGTFGGRFERFGDGHFVYIAYTD